MLLSLSIRWLCWRLGTIGAKQLNGLVVNNYYYEALVACTSAVYPLLWGQCPRTFWWSHALNNPQSKYFTAQYAHSDLLMATCCARAGPYINTCCYISINCDQSHWQMKILIYLLQSLFYLTKSLLKCIAFIWTLEACLIWKPPEIPERKGGRDYHPLSKYALIILTHIGRLWQHDQCPAVSSSSHSSLFTPGYPAIIPWQLGTVFIVMLEPVSVRAPHTGRYCEKNLSVLLRYNSKLIVPLYFISELLWHYCHHLISFYICTFKILIHQSES